MLYGAALSLKSYKSFQVLKVDFDAHVAYSK